MTARRASLRSEQGEHETDGVAHPVAEEAVDERVHAAVGGAEPLCHRDDGVMDGLHGGRLAEVEEEVDDVQRQPAEGEEEHHHHQHLQHPHLGHRGRHGEGVLCGDGGRGGGGGPGYC